MSNLVMSGNLQRIAYHIIGVVSIAILAFILWPKKAEMPALKGTHTLPLSLELADDPSEQELGLSNRETMPLDHGMLFAFPGPANPGFWMKDMRFALDLVWMDAEKTVVQINEHVRPETYPKQTFRAEVPVKYVLEVNAGVAKKLSLFVGQKLDFGTVSE